MNVSPSPINAGPYTPNNRQPHHLDIPYENSRNKDNGFRVESQFVSKDFSLPSLPTMKDKSMMDQKISRADMINKTKSQSQKRDFELPNIISGPKTGLKLPRATPNATPNLDTLDEIT